MFRTLMIGAVSAAAFAQRRFGLIIAAAVLASIFAGLPISTVEAQSGIVGHGQKPGKRVPFKAQRERPQLTPEQKRLMEETLLGRTRRGPPIPEAPAPQRPAAAPAPQQAPPTASPTELLPIDPNTFAILLSTPQLPYTVIPGTSTIAEPQAATNGPIVFYTANWFASFSTDGGASFTFVDPRTQFDSLDGGFCCDQTVIYDQTRDLMIWQLQYVFSLSTGKGSYRIAFANAASVASAGWCVYEFNPGDFGLESGLWLDFPHVALSSNFVWYSANIFNGGGDGRYRTSVIWRIPLDVAANCPSRAFDFFVDDTGTLTQVEGATDTMYWGSHINNASIRIFQWAEADSTPSSTDVNVSMWPQAIPALGRLALCPGPDNLNWCGRADGRILTGWISNGVIGFMWNASQGSGALGDFPFPYVHVARFDASTKALIDEPIIWNATGAFIYPAVGVDDRGDIAGTLYFGGGGNFPIMTALIMDAMSPAPPPPWEVYAFRGSDEGANSWGDYYSSRRNISNGTTWVITGQTLEAGLVQTWYVWMGRPQDAPPTEMSSSGVQGTPPTSASSDFLRFWWDDISRQRRSP